MQVPAGEVLILCGGVLLGVCAIQALIAVLRAFIPNVPVSVARRLGQAVSIAIDGGRDMAPAIAAISPHLRWPYSWRAKAAAAELAADSSAGIVVTLTRHRLLPSSLSASGTAAERLGRTALMNWSSSLAAQPGWVETMFRPLAMYAGVAIILVSIIGFLQIFIVPKFQYIAYDLGMVADSQFMWIASLPSPLLCGVTACVLITGLIGFLGTWYWRRQRRMLAADVILAGTASGASEGEIAAAFGDNVTQAAGKAGDFPALAASVGWPGVTDPTDLAVHLADAGDRGRRWRTWIRLALQVATPVILAIPVWLLASGMFATLISLLDAVGDGGLS